MPALIAVVFLRAAPGSELLLQPGHNQIISDIAFGSKVDCIQGIAFSRKRLLVSTWAGVFAYDTATWPNVPVADENNLRSWIPTHE